MKHRVCFSDVRKAHHNAWTALFGTEMVMLTHEEVIKKYYERFHAKLIADFTNHYVYAEFDSKEDFVMFMLEWS